MELLTYKDYTLKRNLSDIPDITNYEVIHNVTKRVVLTSKSRSLLVGALCSFRETVEFMDALGKISTASDEELIERYKELYALQKSITRNSNEYLEIRIIGREIAKRNIVDQIGERRVLLT